MNRKFILGLIFLIILAIAGILYFYFFNTPSTSQKPSSFLKSIFPFGSNSTPSTNSTDGPLIIGDNTLSNNNPKSLPRLRRLTTEPTAGHIVLEKDKDVIRDRVKTKEKETSVRYIDRATGHIYDIVTNANTSKKISNTTIPKVYEATFSPNGDSLVARLLDSGENILTYYVTLKDKAVPVATSSVRVASSTSETVAEKNLNSAPRFKEVLGTYLVKNIKEVALSTSGRKLLSLTYGTDGGIISTTDSTLKPRTVLVSPLREWLLSYPTDNRAVITTKPSGITHGYAYTLNTDTGSFEKLVGNIIGMTILPNKSLTSYLVGYASETLSLSVLKSKDPALNSLSINTLPEKCYWSNTSAEIVYCAVPSSLPKALYPDDWYKGRLFFNDSLWKINTGSGETTLISNLLVEGGEPIDAINLQLSQSDGYLSFINKKDLTLWGIDLTVK